MNTTKLRAALVVFVVGFTLGICVFAASRLVVRTVLSADATAAAENLAQRVAVGESVDASGALASITRYAVVDAQGGLKQAAALDSSMPAISSLTSEMRAAVDRARAGELIVAQPPLLSNLLGLAEPLVKSAAAPIVVDGAITGAVYAEVEQSSIIESLSHAFAVIGIVTVGLAVLAVVAIVLAVTRGRGVGRERTVFDGASLPRDSLTDLPMRDGFVLALEDAVTRATAADQRIGLMVVNLDGFRKVNDVWGHAAGDAVLRAAAERLRAFAAKPGALARISGDNFALILEDGVTSHSMRQVADRVREALSASYPVEGSTVQLSSTIGAAIFPVNADSAGGLFRSADTALSKAKLGGRNSLSFSDTEMEKRVQRRAALERDLAQALERNEFVVFYQPQLELATGRLRGYEALVRWERAGEGIRSPRDFLEAAEDTGLIRPIGEWVLRKACQDAAAWADKGTVAVNLSSAQLKAPDVEALIRTALMDSGLPPERLEIEIAESLLLENTSEVLATLTRIKALGVRVALDDFGAGYSTLASLARFPFDKVKIDKSFVSQLTEDVDVASVVAAIVGLGRSLSVDVTAEGVETTEQVTLLRAAGCSIVQGFLFGAPRREDAEQPGPRDDEAEFEAEIANLQSGRQSA